MLAEAHIDMEAVDADRNHFRAWGLTVNRDLFGELTVSITFGRIGTRGRTLTTLCEDAAAARAIIRQALTRRARAPRRVGLAYRTISAGGMEIYGVTAETVAP